MESEIFMVNLLVDLSDYGPTFLVTARCGPARRVVWEGGGRNPFLSLLGMWQLIYPLWGGTPR